MTEFYNGEEVVEFVSKCPVELCDNKNYIHWQHKGCTLKEYINSEAEIICTDCKLKKGFYEWRFNCGYHENYKPPTRVTQRMIAAFSLVGRLETNAGKKFLRKLVNKLIDECDQ